MRPPHTNPVATSGIARGDRKRVLHIITTVNRGGAENHLYQLVCAQRAAGLDVTVAYLKGDGYWVSSFAAAGVPCHALKMRRYGDPLPVWRLAMQIREWEPDVVHAHMPPAELYARLALGLAGVRCRYIISKHNDEPFYRGIGQQTMARWAARRADGIIAISSAVATYMQAQGLPSQRISVVHYGLDAGPYDAVTAIQIQDLRHQWGIEPGAMVVGTVGRLVPQKAMHVLLEGFAIFAQSAITPAHLVVVGNGPLESELRALADKLGIADRMVWAGFRTDIPVVMAAFDVFALTSAWEGFGLVLLEAMAAARPIVASRISAIPEVVADGESGILIESGAADQLTCALTRLAKAEMRMGMGEKGRDRLSKNFSVERMAACTAAIYGIGCEN